MTVSAGTAKAGPYTGNNVTSSFAFSFKVFADADIRVVETLISTGVETDLVLNTNYTVTRNADQDNNPGGSITYTVGGVTTALPTTKKLTIVGDFDYEQPTDIPNGGSFFATVIENALDRITLFVKQLKEQADRSMRLPVSSTASVEMPMPEANTVVGWNETADALQNYDAATFASVVAFGTAVADVFDGDGTTTAFTLTSNPAALNNLDVAIGGVTQTPGIDYTWTAGTTITFTTAPPAGTDNVLVRYLQALPQGQGDAASTTYLPSGLGAVQTNVQAKLRESVSVFDFMSAAQIADVQAGTGALDVSAAFNAALSASAFVLVPAGTYKIGSSVTIASGKALVGVDKAVCTLVGAFAGNILDVVSYATNIRLGNFTIRPGAAATACIHTKGLNSSYLHDLYLGYSAATANVAHGLFIEGVQGGNGSYNNTCHNVIGQYLGGTGLYMKSTDGTNAAPRIGSWAFTGYHAYYYNNIGVEFDGTQAISFDNLTSELNATGMKFSLTSGANVTNIAINIQQLYVGNNTSADYVSAANCLIYSNWFMFNGYTGLTADLTAATKGNLFRQGVNFKYTGTPSIEGYDSTGLGTINRPLATSKSLSLQVATAEQYYQQADGKQVWGGDTNLYRLAANQLRTDDALLANGGIGVGNSVAASSTTTIIRAIPVTNASGTLLGYVPIYQSYA